MKKALLLDVSAMMYRAYFSLINMSNNKGEATGAIFGFTNMLLNLIEEYEPDYIIAAFDNKRSSLKRTEKFSEYKAQRKPMPEDLLEQVPKIEKLLDGFGIKKYRVEGHEADDVLGTLAKKYSALGIESFVATGDKDLSQIIDGNINIALLGKGEGKSKTKLIRTDADVVEQLGVTPDMIPDLFGLIGDTSDGIPGVRKVGEKKAIPMLEKYGNLEGIYENIDKLSEIPGIGKGLIQNIIEDKDMAFLSRELAVIELDVPLEFVLEETENTRKDSILFELFMDCDMKSLIKKLDLKEKQVMEVSTEISGKVEDTKEKIEKVFCIPKTDKELNEILDRVFNSEKVFLYSGKFGLSLSNLKESVYIPTKHFYLGANNFSLELVKPYFQKGNKVITYNAKTILNKEFYIENLYFDIAIANYLLTANTRDDLSMIIETTLLENMDMSILNKEENSVTEEEFSKFSFEVLDKLIDIYELLSEKLEKENLDKLFFEVEMPLLKVLSSMETNGVKIDIEFFKNYEIELRKRIESLSPNIYEEFLNRVRFNLEMLIVSEYNIREFYEEIGKLIYKKKSDLNMFMETVVNVSDKELLSKAFEFNIASPKQLGIVLFELMKVPTAKKTKTGYSVDEEVLEELKFKGEKIAEYLLDFRKLTKLQSTYVEALPKLADRNGRIHTTFNQTGTATGRLSSSDPNLQNIPARSDDGVRIREGFVAREGYILASFDYSQIELRVLASVSKDENLITAYNNDLDLHDLTARKIFAVKDEEEVTREMRSVAKIVNFSIIYGKTAFGLAKELGISQSDAKLYIERYFAEYPKVKELETKIIEDAEKKGYVETIYGRKRSIPELKSNNKNLRNAGERMAVNTVIQGSAADILKIVMVKLYEELKGNEEIFMNLQVHDELVFEIRNDKIDFYMEKIKHTMESSVVLPDVKLKVNGAYGNNWSETK